MHYYNEYYKKRVKSNYEGSLELALMFNVEQYTRYGDNNYYGLGSERNNAIAQAYKSERVTRNRV